MMISLLFLAWAAFDQQGPPKSIAPPEAGKAGEEALQELLSVRRVFVDRLSGGDTASQMRDMIISSLENTKLFVITENPERADATLRGSAEDLIFTDAHSSSDSIHAQE